MSLAQKEDSFDSPGSCYTSLSNGSSDEAYIHVIHASFLLVARQTIPGHVIVGCIHQSLRPRRPGKTVEARLS